VSGEALLSVPSDKALLDKSVTPFLSHLSPSKCPVQAVSQTLESINTGTYPLSCPPWLSYSVSVTTMASQNKGPSGMGYERKKRNLTAIPITSPMAASSSSNYRFATQHSANGHSFGPRSPSPPASAYFPLLSADTNTRLRPTPDANAHFAYSTTLRRHQSEGAAALASPAVFAAAVNAEATSLWTRAINKITGRDSIEYQPVENGRATPPAQREVPKDTASGKFAHLTAEVSLTPQNRCLQFVNVYLQATVNYFRTSGTAGLYHSDINTLREQHGYNEFSVASPEPVLLKFAKTIYESPLILLLCGSATVSAIMGNVNDAVSITVAVLIVLTGTYPVVYLFPFRSYLLNCGLLVGFVQERRSEKSLEALNKLVPHHCHVIRCVFTRCYFYLHNLWNSTAREKQSMFLQMNWFREISSSLLLVIAYLQIFVWWMLLILRWTRAV